MFSTELIPAATYTANGVSAWQDTGDGTPNLGMVASALVSNTTGIPNVLLMIQTSSDQVSVYDNTIDDAGLINLPTQRFLRFQSHRRYWRFRWIFFANDPGETSGNSSSSSGQSALSSSSSGGSSSITMSMGLVPSMTG